MWFHLFQQCINPWTILISFQNTSDHKRRNTSDLQTAMVQYQSKIGMYKLLVHIMIATFCVHVVFSIDDVCPQPLVQNPAVPWAAQLQSDKTKLVLHRVNTRRLLNCSFVKSPKLKVCVLYIYQIVQTRRYSTQHKVIQYYRLVLHALSQVMYSHS